MKGIGKHASLFVAVLALLGLLFLAVPKAAAQQDAPPIGGDADDTFNPPPCDFSDQFYGDNGMDITQLIGRFGDNNGTTRLTGPPARGHQKNYVADSNCSTNDPTRRNFRILATTGGNSDDGNSPFTCSNPNAPHPPACNSQSIVEPETFEFISILAFVNSQTAFSSSYLRNVGFINGGLQGVQQNPGTDISIGQASLGEAPAQTLRGFAMQDIVSNFEAYAALRQTTPQGFATGPCSLAMMQQFFGPTATVPSPCFPVADTVVNGQVVSDVATPHLRQDWRFATNRNAIDGSDNNNPFAATVVNAPFGYFCDDLLGMWILTYFWFTQPPNTTDPVCGPVFQQIGAKNGFNTDGTPIILTAFELNVELEANGCGAEAKEDLAGGDGGAVWLICPAIPDPRAGAIATDAFLDQVVNSNGIPQNLALTANFLSLQIFGKFANELTQKQLQQVLSAASSAD
ncbi:MAG TPA: hypothetical protein VI685_03340 [Candidatus Angelobacter sp.]